MAKKLTVSALKTANKQKYDQVEKIELEGDFYVNIYPYARESKIQELIRENIEDMAAVHEDENSKFAELIEIPSFSYIYILRFLTELDIPKNIVDKARIFAELADSGYLHYIVEQFPQETLDRITSGYEIVSESMNQLGNMPEEDAKEMSERFRKATEEVREQEEKVKQEESKEVENKE